MYVLDSATKILTITASAACDVTVSGFRDSTTPPSFSYQTKVGAGETKTICPAGTAAAPRCVDNISVTNTGAANTISVKMDDTGSPDVSTILSSMVLAASEKGQYTHASGWNTLDASDHSITTQGGWTIAAGKAGTLNNSITFAGTDGTTVTFPSTSATVARTDAGQTFTGTNTFGALTLTGNVGVTGTPSFTLTGCSFTAGAGSFTTGTFSSTITSSVTTDIDAFAALTATTVRKVLRLGNTGGETLFGIENSAGNTTITGAAAYSGIFRSTNAIAFSADSGLTLHMNIGNTGVVKITNLAGTGTRTVVVDANGVLSAP